MQQVVKALNNIKAARVNDKDAVNFIKAILEQVRTCGRDTVIHLLMHEAEAADGAPMPSMQHGALDFVSEI
eukprot:6212075-Pleurochrysis_carterae.AAC.8